MVPHIRSQGAPSLCFPKKVHLQLSSKQSIDDVKTTQLDWKRVPQARSRRCKSSVARTAAPPRKLKCQLATESTECCRIRDGSRWPSREADKRTDTGQLHRPCSAYYASSVSNTNLVCGVMIYIVIRTTKCLLNAGTVVKCYPLSSMLNTPQVRKSIMSN